MELGEVICTPQSPRCETCPIARWCRAHAQNLTNQIPAPRRKRAAVHMRIAAAILLDPRGRTLLVQRSRRARRRPLLPHVAVPRRRSHKRTESRARRASPRISKPDSRALELEALPAARHGVTFRNITLLPFLARTKQLPTLPRTRILPLKKPRQLPISSATRKIAAAALATNGHSAITR